MPTFEQAPDPARLAALLHEGAAEAHGAGALDTVAELAAEFLGVPTAFVSVLGPDWQHFAGCCGLSRDDALREGTPIVWSFCRLVVESNAPLAVRDAAEDPRVREHPGRTALGVVAYLGVPLDDGNGPVGSLCVLQPTPREWRPDEIALLQRLARSAESELRLRRRVRELDAALAARSEAEARVRLLFEAASTPAFIYDPVTLEIVEANRAACVLYGFGPGDLTGHSLRDLRAPDQQGTLDAAMMEVRAQPERERSAVYRHRRRDGTAIEVEVTSRPVELRGRVLRFASLRDVTAAVRTERELELLRKAVARLNDILVITEAEPVDGDGPRIVFVNEAFERSTGYSAAEVIGKTPRILQGPKTDRAALDRIRAALHAWQPVRAELINYTKAGEEFWLELDIVPVADADGWFTHWVAVQRNITERKRMEEERRQAQRLEAVGQLAGGIAHDFANITAVIATSAELLRERLGPSHAQDTDLLAISSSADRARALVRQLLAFSRRQVLDIRPLDLCALARSAEHLLHRLLSANVTLRFTMPDAPVWVLADEMQLTQVLLNLAVNARDAMPQGGVLAIMVERSVASAGGPTGRLRVRDSGSGIAPEHLPHIFEPFFTTKPVGQGTGLGLATVHGIIRQIGGDIRVDSALGSGTEFTIDLVLADEIRLPTAAAGSHGDSAAPIGGGDARALADVHVLLVEDEEPLRRATQRLLQRCGARVSTACNGLDALQQLRDPLLRPDVMLTDLMMPGLGGLDLATAVAAQRPGLPIILMSGYDTEAVGPTAGLLPGVAYIQKPFEVDDLVRTVAQAARSRAAA
jgi:PAS domain S-box-containing protein